MHSVHARVNLLEGYRACTISNDQKREFLTVHILAAVRKNFAYVALSSRRLVPACSIAYGKRTEIECLIVFAPILFSHFVRRDMPHF